MYEALGIKNIDAILPPPAPMQPMDPALEHINALGMVNLFKLFVVKITEHTLQLT